jgi:hypothetical protein
MKHRTISDDKLELSGIIIYLAELPTTPSIPYTQQVQGHVYPAPIKSVYPFVVLSVNRP